jgi:hypothetical protein
MTYKIAQNSTLSNGYSPNGSTLQQIKEFLPKGILIPSDIRTKIPQANGKPKPWKWISHKVTQSAAYQKNLEAAVKRGGNICLRFGACSGGLAGLDIDSDAGAVEFLALNPQFEETFQRRGKKGVLIVFYPTGDYPQSQGIYPASWGEWRVGGNNRAAEAMVFGLHPDGMPYVINGKLAIRSEFGKIVWPNGWPLPWTKGNSKKEDPEFQAWAKEHFKWNLADLDYKGLLDYFKEFFEEKPDAEHPNMILCSCPREHLHKNPSANTDLTIWQKPGEIPTCFCFHTSCGVTSLRYLLDYYEAKEPGIVEKFCGGSIPFTGSVSASTSVEFDTCQNSTEGYVQKAVYPPDSIIQDYHEFAVSQTEAADSYIVGGLMPMCAALLERRVWFQWGARRKYPNQFAMLAGKAGDRKSDAIVLAWSVLKPLIARNKLIPKSFSPESLFDEYDEERGNTPDKLWIVTDGNTVLTDWRKTANGARNEAQFLDLYDCEGISESFRRNRGGQKTAIAMVEVPTTRRFIEETSTSIVMGATLNVACFQGQSQRAGMARRFVNYLAESHGRIIVRPEYRDTTIITEQFRKLSLFGGVVDFEDGKGVLDLWSDFQYQNRADYREVNSSEDSEASRLSSIPMQTLGIAMIFQACVCAKQNTPLHHISGEVLQYAIEHMEGCLEAAKMLSLMADRVPIQNAGEVMLITIRKDWQAMKGWCEGEWIYLTRGQITYKFGRNPDRPTSWLLDDIYNKFIPMLIQEGDARFVSKEGKKETYAFRIEKK